MNKTINNKVVCDKKKKNWKEIGFITSIVIFPIIQFLIFYIVVNFNSILLSFQEYTISINYLEPDKISFVGFKNYEKVLSDLFSPKGGLLLMAKNSLIVYVCTLLFMPIQWLVSYCIWRKIPGSEVFKVMLFLPSMITGIIWVVVIKHIMIDGVPHLALLSADKALLTQIIYSFWLGFAGGMVLYLGAMTSISPSIIESAKLDGANDIKVFFHIIFPSIFPTITTFLVVGVAGFFTNQLSLFSFYGSAAPENTWTLGYYFFVQVIADAALPFYPYASAAGIVFTLIAAPITLLVRRLLEKFGPSEV